MREDEVIDFSKIFRRADPLIGGEKVVEKELDMARGGIFAPAEGGIETFFIGDKYPKKGIMIGEAVRSVGIYKRGIITLARIAAASPFRYFVGIMFLLPDSVFEKITKMVAGLLIEWGQKSLGKWYLQPRRFCKSGREIWRVLKESEIADIICTCWEFDIYYRYVLQDIAGEARIDEAREKPDNEIIRLFRILADRTYDEGPKNNWLRLLKLAEIGLRFKRGFFKKILLPILREVNLEEIKLDTGDKYHCYWAENYDFGGLPLEKRKEIWKNL